jgi:hypothetical protein
MRTSNLTKAYQNYSILRPKYTYDRRAFIIIIPYDVALGGLVVSVLATGPKVRGLKPGRERWILTLIKSVARHSSEGK